MVLVKIRSPAWSLGSWSGQGQPQKEAATDANHSDR